MPITIIPPEFFGLYAGGEAARDFASVMRYEKERKRQHKREDELDALRRVSALQQINPLAPATWRTEDIGLDPSAIELTADQILGKNTSQLFRDRPDLLEGVTLSRAAGLPFGVSPEQATRGAERQEKLGELQIDEATRKANYDKILDTYLESKGLSRGTVEGMQLIGNLTAQELNIEFARNRNKYGPLLDAAQLRFINSNIEENNAQAMRARALAGQGGQQQIDWELAFAKDSGIPFNVVHGVFTGAIADEAVKDGVLGAAALRQKAIAQDMVNKISKDASKADKLNTIAKYNATIRVADDDNVIDKLKSERNTLIADLLGDGAAVLEVGKLFTKEKIFTSPDEIANALEKGGKIIHGGGESKLPTSFVPSTARAAFDKKGGYEGAVKYFDQLIKENRLTLVDKSNLLQELEKYKGTAPKPPEPTAVGGIPVLPAVMAVAGGEAERDLAAPTKLDVRAFGLSAKAAGLNRTLNSINDKKQQIEQLGESINNYPNPKIQELRRDKIAKLVAEVEKLENEWRGGYRELIGGR